MCTDLTKKIAVAKQIDAGVIGSRNTSLCPSAWQGVVGQANVKIIIQNLLEFSKASDISFRS